MFRIINVSERTCKLTWSGNWSSINGTGTVYYLPEGATLYASPYLVVTPQGYTKHYYAEAERITSQLGKGQFADVGTPVVSDSLVQEKLQAVTDNVEYPSTLTVPGSGTFAYLDTLTNQQNATSTLYFYHPDHLGSSSWITTVNAKPVQHLHYLPWGEDFINQRASGYIGAHYTFSAKEKDSETNLSYFGARYYTSDLSIWLSVDPMSAKYPSLSPYVYCANNPVKLVDPNGESISEFDENGNYLRTIKDNWFHNTFYGRKGHIVDDDGNMMHEFSFGDPEHDVQDLKDGKITKVIFVQEKEIKQMLENSGVFNSKNKTYNNSFKNRYNYIFEQGQGKGKLDFSVTEIPLLYRNASKFLFLVNGIAYNHYNFGNFLFGAAGAAMGFSLFELRVGAHYNSIFNSRTNGYSPQFDSPDDQTAIKNGVNYAKQHGY